MVTLLKEIWERIFMMVWNSRDIIQIRRCCVQFYSIISNNETLLRRCLGPSFKITEESNLSYSKDGQRASVRVPITVDYPCLERMENIAFVDFQGNAMKCVFLNLNLRMSAQY